MTWAVVALMAVITFMNRFLFLLPGLSFVPNEKLRLLLDFASLSVLTVIWVPFVLTWDKHAGMSITGYDYIIGSLLALFLTWLRVHTLLVISVSFIGFSIVRWVF